jgi:hypothetical protein
MLWCGAFVAGGFISALDQYLRMNRGYITLALNCLTILAEVLSVTGAGKRITGGRPGLVASSDPNLPPNDTVCLGSADRVRLK